MMKISKMIPDCDLDKYQLVARIKAMYKLERQATYGMYVKHRGLSPDIDAKEYFGIYDNVSPNMQIVSEEFEFKATHINRITRFKVMMWREESGCYKFVDEHGGTGSSPPFTDINDQYEEV